MGNKYSLLEAFYGSSRHTNRKYSLKELLTESSGAGIDAQIKVGTWVLSELNKSTPHINAWLTFLTSITFIKTL